MKTYSKYRYEYSLIDLRQKVVIRNFSNYSLLLHFVQYNGYTDSKFYKVTTHRIKKEESTSERITREREEIINDILKM